MEIEKKENEKYKECDFFVVYDKVRKDNFKICMITNKYNKDIFKGILMERNIQTVRFFMPKENKIFIHKKFIVCNVKNLVFKNYLNDLGRKDLKCYLINYTYSKIKKKVQEIDLKTYNFEIENIAKSQLFYEIIKYSHSKELFYVYEKLYTPDKYLMVRNLEKLMFEDQQINL